MKHDKRAPNQQTDPLRPGPLPPVNAWRLRPVHHPSNAREILHKHGGRREREKRARIDG